MRVILVSHLEKSCYRQTIHSDVTQIPSGLLCIDDIVT